MKHLSAPCVRVMVCALPLWCLHACSSDSPAGPGSGGSAGASGSGGSTGGTGGASGSGGSGGSSAGGAGGSTTGAGGSSTGGSAGSALGGSTGAGGSGQTPVDAGGTGGTGGQATEAGSTDGAGGASGRDGSAEAAVDGASSEGSTACAGAGRSLHFQDDVGGATTVSTQVLADLGPDLPIGNTARTIEMWLYMEGNESWKAGHSIIEYGGVARCQAFGIDGGDTGAMNPPQFDPFTFSAGGTCAGDNNVAITPAPPRTGWLHVAYAYDPAGIGGQATTNFLFTVNGLAQAIPSPRQTPTGALVTMRTVISIGSGQDASSDTGNGFTGKIDEVRIWNVGRTAQEIADNYRLILRGDEPGLVAYYHFDDGMGTTARDASTKRHDAMFAASNGRPAPTWVESTGLTLTCKP